MEKTQKIEEAEQEREVRNVQLRNEIYKKKKAANDALSYEASERIKFKRDEEVRKELTKKLLALNPGFEPVTDSLEYCKGMNKKYKLL